jgi:hypothetical protein
MVERDTTLAPARRNGRRKIVVDLPSASGSEDVAQKPAPTYRWHGSTLRADRPTPTVKGMYAEELLSDKICTCRLDNGFLIDGTP